MTTIIRRPARVALVPAPSIATEVVVPKLAPREVETRVARALRIRREVIGMFEMAKRGET